MLAASLPMMEGMMLCKNFKAPLRKLEGTLVEKGWPTNSCVPQRTIMKIIIGFGTIPSDIVPLQMYAAFNNGVFILYFLGLFRVYPSP